MTEHAYAEDTEAIAERDDTLEERVAEALQTVAADARRDPEAYASQTEVEHGGE